MFFREWISFLLQRDTDHSKQGSAVLETLDRNNQDEEHGASYVRVSLQVRYQICFMVNVGLLLQQYSVGLQ